MDRQSSVQQPLIFEKKQNEKPDASAELKIEHLLLFLPFDFRPFQPEKIFSRNHR